MPDLETLQYPIGRFNPADSWTRNDLDRWIDVIAACPENLRTAVRELDDAQLDTPYRPDGWTVRQVVHHVLDSHLNAYVRIKLGLTEDVPRISTYDQDEWARLSDSITMRVGVSLSGLEAIHDRLVTVLRAMKTEEFDRRINHPEGGLVPLGWLVQMYRWHSLHHVAHVTELRERSGWNG